MTSKNSRHGYRDSRNGQFVKKKYTEKHKETTQKESIPNPGRGNTDKTKNKTKK
ncbi:MAG: hypothetical protein FD153_622 [Rhodospirillaceae bacterium]|nr:MAG: hypothetical protein FD153_622 [Rhodospirillaceae bacterium]